MITGALTSADLELWDLREGCVAMPVLWRGEADSGGALGGQRGPEPPF